MCCWSAELLDAMREDSGMLSWDGNGCLVVVCAEYVLVVVVLCVQHHLHHVPK